MGGTSGPVGTVGVGAGINEVGIKVGFLKLTKSGFIVRNRR